MSDLLRIEKLQVFLLEKPLSCVLMKATMRLNWRLVEELLLRPSGNGA